MSRLDPTNARSRRTSTALLEAARDLLEEHGSDGITMAAVADRAAVSRRAVYLHFASRTELLTALFVYVNEVGDLGDGLAAVADAPDAETTLRTYAEFLVTYVPRILTVSIAVQRAAATDEGAAEHWATAMKYRREHCGMVIGRVDTEGRLAPGWTAATATDMLLALVSNDVLVTLLDDCGWMTADAATRLGNLFCRSFLD